MYGNNGLRSDHDDYNTDRNEKLTQLMIHVGDQPHELQRNMEAIVFIVTKDVETEKPTFLPLLMQCVKELPMKTPAYSTLVGMINLQNAALVGEIVNTASNALDEAILAGDFRFMKYLLRFFGGLVNANVISAGSFMNLVSGMLAALDMPGLKSELVDAIVFIVLGSLPWVARRLSADVPGDFEALLARIGGFMAQRRSTLKAGALGLVFDALKVYRDCPPEEPYIQIDRLENLWIQLQNMQSRSWTEELLLKPFESLDQAVDQPTLHTPRDVSLPTEFRSSRIPEQEPLFWVFDDSVNTEEKRIADLPPTSTIERFIMDDIAVDTIYLHSHNHIECSQLLLGLPNCHAETDYNFYQAIVENLIRELIKLPASQEKSVYYATLLFDLCKSAPDKIPSAMGRSIRTIFSRMDSKTNGSAGGMDVECIRRFSEWFSHHLSNFNFTWKWIDWESTVEDEESGRFCFIRDTLERSMRLSYYDRIRGTIPDSFANGKLFPTQAPTFVYRYDQKIGNDELDGDIVLIRHGIQSKLDFSEVINYLTDLYNHRLASRGDGMEIDGLENPGPAWNEDAMVRDVFVQTLLFLGHKSFSHFLNIVERYIKVLHQLNTKPEDKLHIIRIASGCFASNHQFLEIVLDKFINYRVIDPLSLINWVMSEETHETSVLSSHIWSILRTALSKVNTRVVQIRDKLAAARKESEDAMMDDVDATAELQTMLDNANRDQKEAYIKCFQKFNEVLSEMLQNGTDPASSVKWRWVSGQMRNIGRTFRKEIKTCAYTIEATAFADATDARILQVWKEIRAVADLMI
ncbi:Component of the cap-binding complex (CBC) [Chytridiales sp. JEL 0842]|nr:Component of the cap-binding complex (CBC) [Chytridiales sp. JEL 0842]